jgi:hypothetical protein
MKSYRLLLSVILLSAVGFAQNYRLNPRPVNPNDGTPLMSASQSLQMAIARIIEERPEAAGAALREAWRQLGVYQQLFPGPRAGQVELMRQQILAQTTRMHDDPYEIADRIFFLWLEPVDRWNFRAGR